LRNVSPVNKSYGKDGWFVKTFEEQKAFLARMNVIDDQFFQKVVEDREVCEEILRILLQKPDLHVVDYQAQRHLRNIGAHSVILDLLCQDDTGALFNVEVQKADNDDHQKRMRFNISNIDTTFVEKGIDYKDLPDVFAIFLSQFDLFQENRTTYHVHRAITETGTRVENGIHEIYINTAIDDGTAISQLMQFFLHSVGDNPLFPKLTKRVHYFKEEQKGVAAMTNVFEEYAEERAKERVKEAQREFQKESQEKERATALNFLKEGVSVETIAKALPSLSLDFIKQLKQQLPQA
jgi:predicted transposase/invertase (TIGR01784 family)